MDSSGDIGQIGVNKVFPWSFRQAGRMNVAGDPIEPENIASSVAPPPSGFAARFTWRRVIAPVLLLASIIGVGVLLQGGEEKSSTPLGSAAVMDGGLARINGIVPVEADGWIPPSTGEAEIFDMPAGALS